MCISTTGLRAYPSCGGRAFTYTNMCNERLYVRVCWREVGGGCLCEGLARSPGQSYSPWTCNPNGTYRLWAYPDAQAGTICQPPEAC
jgi:hypothetical protein